MYYVRTFVSILFTFNNMVIVAGEREKIAIEDPAKQHKNYTDIVNNKTNFGPSARKSSRLLNAEF